MQTVCIVAIIKNESAYLKEWISYHKMIGVNHFMIYDNNSNDNLLSELEKFILHGLVTLINFPHRINAQVDAYNHALMLIGKYDWVLVIDPDEFLDMCDYGTIQNYLTNFEDDVTSIQFPWKTFNNSGHIVKPDSLVIESYTYCDPNEQKQETNMVKSLTKINRISSISIHQCVTYDGKTMKNSFEETGRSPTWFIENADFNYPTINHYFTKSLEEFTAKINRGQSNGTKEKKLSLFNKNIGDYQDFRILNRVSELKVLLNHHDLLASNPSIYGDAYGMNTPRDYFDAEFNRYLHDTLTQKQDLSHAAPDLMPEKVNKSLYIYPLDLIEKNLDIKNISFQNSIFQGIHFDDFLRIMNIQSISGLEINLDNLIDTSFYCRLYIVISIAKTDGLQFDIFFNGNKVEEINNHTFNNDLVFLYKFNNGKLIYSNKNYIRIESNMNEKFIEFKVLVRY